MIEWNNQTIWNVALGSSNALILLALIFLMRKRKSDAPLKTTTGTGTFCGHCGRPLPPDPVRVVVLVNTNYFVYQCSACRNETLLPTQKFS